jgi:hypothetical protein
MFCGWFRDILGRWSFSTILGLMKFAVAPELIREVKCSA